MLDPRIVAARIHGPSSLPHGASTFFAAITPSSHGDLTRFTAQPYYDLRRDDQHFLPIFPTRGNCFIKEREAMRDMRYAVIVEEGETSFGAYVPDLPGCVAVAETRNEVLRLIEEAIEFHVDGLRQDGQPIPEPSSSIEYVEVRAA